MEDKQSWKRGESGDKGNRFRVPKVVDEETPSDDFEDFFDDYEDITDLAEFNEKWDKYHSRSRMTKFFTALFGFVSVVSVYAVAFFFGLTALGVESLEYRDAVIVSACFVFIRIVDTAIIQQAKKR